MNEPTPTGASEVPNATTRAQAYFAYDPNGSFEVFDTFEKAKKTAEESMDYYQSEAANDGWSEEVNSVCYGVILGDVHEISRKPSEDPRFDEIIDYRLIARAPDLIAENAALREEVERLKWDNKQAAISYNQTIDVLRQSLTERDAELARLREEKAHAQQYGDRQRQNRLIAEKERDQLRDRVKELRAALKDVIHADTARQHGASVSITDLAHAALKGDGE